MRRLDPLSQTKPRELDRKMWADIDRLMYKFQVKGRGEYFFEEPIFFGTAFTSPPVLSYSTITGGVGDDVLPYRVVPPKGYAKDVDAYHLGEHSQGANFVITDPGFEVQGQFIPLMGDDAREIPITSDYPSSTGDWPNLIAGVWSDNSYTPQNDWYTRKPVRQNSWIQTDEVRGRWTVTDDRSQSYGVGAPGDYSAKFTFVNGGSSPWLIPMGWQSGYSIPENLGADIPATAHWGFYSLRTFGYVEGGVASPPVMDGWGGSAAVWSDDDCELEVWTYNWWENELDTHDPEWWDYAYMPLEYGGTEPLRASDIWNTTDDSSVARLGNDVKVTVPVVGGRWNDLSFHLSRARNQWQPGGPELRRGPWYMQETFRFRINQGSSGQVVHLDNVFVWPDVRNIYAPMVTIGVAEWVQDEQGAYIGTKLWVKVGDV
jgi:hypothetical protein